MVVAFLWRPFVLPCLISVASCVSAPPHPYQLFHKNSSLRKGIDNFPASIYFTHVMKCGGSTLDRLLSLVSDERGIEYTTSETPKMPSAEKFLPSALKIVVVREPISRVISHYWQLVPHGTHKGGSHPRCTAAAKKSFRSFLKGCRKYSSDFMIQYFDETTGYSLQQYDLVIPYENYNEGVLMLHLFAGFSVKNILYVSQKNKTRPRLELEGTDRTIVRKYNRMDAVFYAQAVDRWHMDTSMIRATHVFSTMLRQYLALLNEYHAYYNSRRPLNILAWCRSLNSDAERQFLTRNRDYNHASLLDRGPVAAAEGSKSSEFVGGNLNLKDKNTMVGLTVHIENEMQSIQEYLTCEKHFDRVTKEAFCRSKLECLKNDLTLGGVPPA